MITPVSINDWVNYWYYEVGANVIPADTRNKKTWVQWSQYQVQALPPETLDQWRNEKAFDKGVAIIAGKLWRGKNAGQYLIFVDCDNTLAIAEFLTRNSQMTTLENFAKRTIVEQHKDDPTKAHVYLISPIPFPKKSSDIRDSDAAEQISNNDLPAIEVKGLGTHGIAYCTPSLHRNGSPYEIIGTLEPTALNRGQASEMIKHVDDVCKRYGLHYVTDSDDDRQGLTVKDLWQPDAMIAQGHNRHEAVLRVMESLINRNKGLLTLEKIRDLAVQWNQEHCVPALGDDDLSRQWRDATRFVERNPADMPLDKPMLKLGQYPTIALKDIKITAQLGTTMAVEGRVIAISDVDGVVDKAVFKCPNPHCNAVLSGSSSKRCKNCDEQGVLDLKESTIRDRQIVKIQEIAYSGQPARLTAVFKEPELLWTVKVGTIARLTGILNADQIKDKRGKITFAKWLETIDVELLQNDDIVITKSDIDRFRREAAEPFFWEKLLASFMPHVVGYEEIKEALILLLASLRNDRPLNVLLGGDPGLAKTLMLQYCQSIAPNGHYVSFASVTWPGLSVTAQKDDDVEAWIMVPGAFALADMGLFCGDELHTISEEIAPKLNEVGDQKSVSYAKAGNVGSMPARCAWLFACNSKFGRWKTNANLQENLRFLGSACEAFISRFALIFIMRDVVHEANDAKIAGQVVKNTKAKIPDDDWNGDDGCLLYGTNTLKKFFAYLTSSVTMPEIPADLEQGLIQYYQAQRQDARNQDWDHKPKITARFLADTIRLAQLKARVMHKERVDQTDIDHAIRLLEKSRNEAAFDPETQEVDGSMLDGNKPQSTIRRNQNVLDQFWQAYKDAANSGDFALEDTWIDRLVNTYHWESHKAEKMIKAAENNGELMLGPKNKSWRKQ